MSSAGGRRWWAMGATMLAVLAVGMDITVLSVALPTLSGALKASESDLQWFSSAYTLVLAAMMLPAGLLGDRYGRKKVMLASLALFAAGSLGCAYSKTPMEFIGARILLGFAGAGIVVMAISALTVLFSAEERPRAISIWAAVNMIAFPIGPILGGWLLTHVWWGWVFLMNVPVAVLGFVAVASLVPETRSGTRPGIDIAGIVLSSAGLAAMTYGFIEAGQHGWGSPRALGLIFAGLAVIGAFFLWERMLERRPGGQPLVDLQLFSSPSFTWGVVLFTILTLALIGLLFTMPQFFQGVMATTAQGSGIRLLPAVGGMFVGLIPAPRIARAIGAKLTVGMGFCIVGAGLFLGSSTTATSGEGFVALWMAITGAGTGITMATAASAALVELSAERAGIGSGVLQALKNTGAPLGSAILGSALSSTYVGKLRLSHLPPAAVAVVRESIFGGVAVARLLHSTALLHEVRSAFAHGVDTALVISVGIAALGLVVTLAFLPSRGGHREAAEPSETAGEQMAA